MSYDIFTGLLKAFSLPTEGKKEIHFSYDNNHTKFCLLKSTYPIETIAGDGDDFSKAVNLLHWVSSHTYHKGDYDGTIAHNSLDLLDYAYDKGSIYGINCVALATILSECLLSIGLKARIVFLMPCSPYDGDNHVVTHVYIRQMKKWVMLDPTLNAFFSNE
ncbi:MAG: transglutaminase domain-containing protein, partial [Vallitaleaceae bacterium]|nr:transglutaminase domain-containing protein [Vallitaleaceae bacterium]